MNKLLKRFMTLALAPTFMLSAGLYANELDSQTPAANVETPVEEAAGNEQQDPVNVDTMDDAALKAQLEALLATQTDGAANPALDNSAAPASTN